MKIALILIVVIVVAGLVWADYKWHRWMDKRHRDRD
jgi:hypothetical protein